MTNWKHAWGDETIVHESNFINWLWNHCAWVPLYSKPVSFGCIRDFVAGMQGQWWQKNDRKEGIVIFSKCATASIVNCTPFLSTVSSLSRYTWPMYLLHICMHLDELCNCGYIQGNYGSHKPGLSSSQFNRGTTCKLLLGAMCRPCPMVPPGKPIFTLTATYFCRPNCELASEYNA